MIKISFFSYKGGAGRSSIAYNVVPLLANELHATSANPIILIDMDIDSAGMTFLLKREIGGVWNAECHSTDKLVAGRIPGLTYAPDSMPIESHPYFSKLIPAGKAFGLNEDRSILFVPVKPGASIENYDRAGNPLLNLSKLCQTYGCKAILFDTPTGDQLTAGWSTEVSKKIVCCMRVTYQFRSGTVDYLNRKDGAYEEKEHIVVPNAVPYEEIIVDDKVFDLATVKNTFVSYFTERLRMENNSVNLGMLDGDYFGIPEVKSFKIQEGIIYKSKNIQPDEQKALDCYRHLARILGNNADGVPK